MSDLTKQSELKNCPFCGHRPLLLLCDDGGALIECRTSMCAMEGHLIEGDSEEEAARIWNTRPASAGVREALIDVLTSEKLAERARFVQGFIYGDDYVVRDVLRDWPEQELNRTKSAQKHADALARAKAAIFADAISALSDHGVQKSGGANTKSDGSGVRHQEEDARSHGESLQQGGDTSNTHGTGVIPRGELRDVGNVANHPAVPGGALRTAPGPSDSLLSKTLSEGGQRSIATKQSTDPEGGSRTETAGGAA